jgi:hypothetical protein
VLSAHAFDDCRIKALNMSRERSSLDPLGYAHPYWEDGWAR